MTISLSEHDAWILTAQAPDGPGLIAAITSAVAQAGGNIVDMQQHSDPYLNTLGCRVVVDGELDGRRLGQEMSRLADARQVEWRLDANTTPPPGGGLLLDDPSLHQRSTRACRDR